MAALVIGEAQRHRIAELRAFAAANPMKAEAAVTTAAKDMVAWRDFMQNLSIDLPVSYRVTYSHENQPCGLVAHISISVDRPKKLPHPAAVEMILNEFGMQPLQDSIKIFVEDVGPTLKAINVLQFVPHHTNQGT